MTILNTCHKKRKIGKFVNLQRRTVLRRYKLAHLFFKQIAEIPLEIWQTNPQILFTLLSILCYKYQNRRYIFSNKFQNRPSIQIFEICNCLQTQQKMECRNESTTQI